MKDARTLRDFPGDEPIFVDANIFLHHAFDSRPAASEFLTRIESTGVAAWTSVLVFEEVFYILLAQAAATARKTSSLGDLKRALRDSEVRIQATTALRKYAGYLDWLKACGLRVADLTSDDLPEALTIVSESGLITADACHLAVMRRKGIAHIATGDADFVGLDGITVWKP